MLEGQRELIHSFLRSRGMETRLSACLAKADTVGIRARKRRKAAWTRNGVAGWDLLSCGEHVPRAGLLKWRNRGVGWPADGVFTAQRTAMSCWAVMAREPGEQPPSSRGTSGHVSAGSLPRLPMARGPQTLQEAKLPTCVPRCPPGPPRGPVPRGIAAATSQAAGPLRIS